VRGALRDHLALALTPVILLTALAGIVAFQRTPSYRAESSLTLGRLDAAAQAPQYATVTRQLAAAYAQALQSPAVTRPAAAPLRITSAEAGRRLSGTPADAAPLLTVHATGGSAGEAIELANDGANSLARYVDGVNSSAGARGAAASRALQVLAPATSASSDRMPVARRLFLIAAMAGLVLGALLALRSANRPLEKPAARVRAAPIA
jgi:capsular polysaccharide biosynthesis protein